MKNETRNPAARQKPIPSPLKSRRSKRAQKLDSDKIGLVIRRNSKADQIVQELIASGKPVYYMDPRRSPHILRRTPNGRIEEVEMTANGEIHVIRTLAFRDKEASTLDHRGPQRSR